MQFDLSNFFGLTEKQREAVKVISSVYNEYDLEWGSATKFLDRIYNSETSEHDNFNSALYDLGKAFNSFTSDLSLFPTIQKAFLDNYPNLPDDTDILYDENVDYDNLSDDERYDYESENKDKLAEILDGLRDGIENLFSALEKRSEKLLNGFAVNEYLDTDNMQTLTEFLNVMITSKNIFSNFDKIAIVHPASKFSIAIAEQFPELKPEIDFDRDVVRVRLNSEPPSLDVYKTPGDLRMAIYAENNNHEVNTFKDLADHAFIFVHEDYQDHPNSEENYLLDDVLVSLVDTMGLVDQIYQDQIDLGPYLPQPELTVKKHKSRGL